MAKKIKRKASQATRERLKALRKKHGLGEFAPKGQAFSKKRVRRIKTKPLYRKRNTTVAMARRIKRKKSYKRGLFSNPKVKSAIGAASYAVVGEPVLEMVASKLGLSIQDDFVKVAAGLLSQHRKMPPLVKGMGQAAVVIGVSNIAKNRVGNLLGSFSSSSTNNQGSGW